MKGKRGKKRFDAPNFVSCSLQVVEFQRNVLL